MEYLTEWNKLKFHFLSLQILIYHCILQIYCLNARTFNSTGLGDPNHICSIFKLLQLAMNVLWEQRYIA